MELKFPKELNLLLTQTIPKITYSIAGHLLLYDPNLSREATIGAMDRIKTMTLMPRVLRQVTGDLPPVIHSVAGGHIKSEARLGY